MKKLPYLKDIDESKPKMTKKINFTGFNITGSEIETKKLWWVWTFTDSKGEKFKSRPSENNLQHFWNVINGGQGKNVSDDLAGVFEKQSDAQNFYDAIDLREEE